MCLSGVHSGRASVPRLRCECELCLYMVRAEKHFINTQLFFTMSYCYCLGDIFPIVVLKTLTEATWVRKGFFDSQFKGSLWWGYLEPGARGSWSHCFRCQRNEYWFSACFCLFSSGAQAMRWRTPQFGLVFPPRWGWGQFRNSLTDMSGSLSSRCLMLAICTSHHKYPWPLMPVISDFWNRFEVIT